jgi:hypothetical protein
MNKKQYSETLADAVVNGSEGEARAALTAELLSTIGENGITTYEAQEMLGLNMLRIRELTRQGRLIGIKDKVNNKVKWTIDKRSVARYDEYRQSLRKPVAAVENN